MENNKTTKPSRAQFIKKLLAEDMPVDKIARQVIGEFGLPENKFKSIRDYVYQVRRQGSLKPATKGTSDNPRPRAEKAAQELPHFCPDCGLDLWKLGALMHLLKKG